jgi:hypothetical protein
LKMMRCTCVEKFLPLYVAGDLAGQRAARHVARHLATCERCRLLSEEYAASREFVREAATLPPDFDGAFYAEIRRSVLDEIKRERTPLAPSPAFAGFASLFNARFAYAASVVLIFLAVAAFSLNSYIGRKSEIANVNGGRTGKPSATPVLTVTTASSNTPSVEAVKQNLLAATNGRTRQTTKPLALKRRETGGGNAQNETQRSLNFANNAPADAGRHPRSPVAAAPDKRKEEIASSNSSGGETTLAPEVSRIEIQTSDPNIRIIWLSPRPDAATEPLK